jgi:hypothetical protein
MTATITWYMRLDGWWLGIASITRSIVSGSGRARTSTLRRTRAALRRDRPFGAGGHGSAPSTSSSTARRTQARATLRNRDALDGDRTCPVSPIPSLRSTSPSRLRSRSSSVRHQRASHSSHSSSGSISAAGGNVRTRCRRSTYGGGGAPSATARATKRASASIAEVRVRGCHSFHCSAIHRRHHACTCVGSARGRHDSGSPLGRSNRSSL